MVDTEGCIVGIVTFDDAIGVLTEETTEDMQKMAAMEANTDRISRPRSGSTRGTV